MGKFNYFKMLSKACTSRLTDLEVDELCQQYCLNEANWEGNLLSFQLSKIPDIQVAGYLKVYGNKLWLLYFKIIGAGKQIYLFRQIGEKRFDIRMQHKIFFSFSVRKVRVAFRFGAYGGTFVMSGANDRVSRQNKQLSFYGFHQFLMTSGREIRPAHAAQEQRIPGKKHLLFRNIVTGSPYGMPRCMQHLDLHAGIRNHVPVMKKMICFRGKSPSKHG